MPGSTSSDDQGADLDIFQEPEGFREPEKQPTFAQHRMLDGRDLNVRLVGHNPLWGHHLWNAGRVLAHYLETHASSYLHSRKILELGAGAGLPSLISAKSAATFTLVTDYPDAELIQNLTHNISTTLTPDEQTRITAEGFLWGADPAPLLNKLPQDSQSSGFDTLILADVLFNHSQQPALLQTLLQTLSRSNPEACALVFFTPYRPWLLEKDMAFFDLARGRGLVVEKVLETRMERVMFEGDPGDEEVRRTVFGFEVKWGGEGAEGKV
ncbi:hypothetical protein MBLNU230_g6656t1 [Neophaeotheca triangularis]